MKTVFTTIAGLFLSLISISQTTDLVAGDIAILQYNPSTVAGSEVIQFIAKRSMDAGTIINFTDNGWSGSALNTNEGTTVWTAPSNITCGQVITLTLDGANFDLDPSKLGDQILAYQGSAGSEVFLFGIIGNDGGAWHADASTVNNSVLPSPLVVGTDAIALTVIATGSPASRQTDFKYNTTSFSGTKTAIITDISTVGNWTGANATAQTYSGTFTSVNTWTTTWSGGVGTSNDYFNAVLDGDYDTSTDGDFSACECTVNNTRTLTVNSGGTVTIENIITNNGTILVQDDGAIVQVSDGANTGTTYTVERQTTLLDSEGIFTYWASPLTNSTLAEIVSDAKWYYSFVASTQTWTVGSSSTAMSPGLGYAVTSTQAGSFPLNHTASFTGSAFNNGDISVTLGFIDDADADTDWNLLGNPYPSAIDADAFLAANSATIGGTLYFWTHDTPDTNGNNVATDYVSWNGTGGTAGCSSGVNLCILPDGNIASGQGFFAQALSSGTVTDLFTNAFRVSGNNTKFYKGATTTEEKDRIWLNLTTENGFNQLLIGFFEDATDGFDSKYDGIRIESGASLSFNSLIDGEPYAIQGKASLTALEEIPLSITSTKTGEFTITIDRFEGKLNYSFIYLLDNLLGIQHNLKDGDYSFTIDEQGTYNDRFVLKIATDEEFLDPEDNDGDPDLTNQLIVTQHANQLKIETTDYDTISKVEVYDLFGNKLAQYDKKPRKTVIVSSKNLKSNSIIIIKVLLATGEIFIQKHYKN